MAKFPLQAATEANVGRRAGRWVRRALAIVLQVAGYRGQARRPRPQPGPGSASPSGERLQKVLAAAGLGSRRQCEELITTGRVEIDRKVVTELGSRVDLAVQDVRVDGESLSLGRRVYYAVNKPKGVVSTNHDPGGRPRVIDLVPSKTSDCFQSAAWI